MRACLRLKQLAQRRRCWGWKSFYADKVHVYRILRDAKIYGGDSMRPNRIRPLVETSTAILRPLVLYSLRWNRIIKSSHDEHLLLRYPHWLRTWAAHPTLSSDIPPRHVHPGAFFFCQSHDASPVPSSLQRWSLRQADTCQIWQSTPLKHKPRSQVSIPRVSVHQQCGYFPSPPE